MVSWRGGKRADVTYLDTGRPVGDRQAEEANPFRGNLSWNDQGISASNQEMTTIPKTGKS